MYEHPAVGRTQIDDDAFRVTEWRFAPGAATGWHVHEFDYVVVPMTTGQLRAELPDGTSVVADLVAGVSYTRPARVEHNVHNPNDHEFVFIEVERR